MNFLWLLNFFSKAKSLLTIPNRFKLVLSICLAIGIGSVLVKVGSRLKNRSRGSSSSIKPPSINNANNSEKSSHASSSGKNDLMRYIIGKKVSCSTMGTIFQYDNYGSKIVIIESQLNSLLQLASHTDLYLITQCSSTTSLTAEYSINGEGDNDEAFERQIMDLLETRKVFAAGLNRNKVLFCSTVMGKAHIARNLEPQLHIDSDLIVINALKSFVPQLGFIHFPTTSVDSDKINNVENAAPISHDNVHVIQELHQLVNPV
eukprot:TRINITY_DN6443_c0_g2_i1.p1 TRINITY_DN6443_c0_g2~~TRINITY_DN6443_c0_g2_i1.p1  ORF type:complete len:261 (-),score=43.04 TRINITY_DN6443_c0_g2_i1:91-873(-)